MRLNALPHLQSLNLKLHIGYRLNASAGMFYFYQGYLIVSNFYHWFGGEEGATLVGDHCNLNLC